MFQFSENTLNFETVLPFSHRWIGNSEFPRRSQDLTPMDVFPGVNVKDNVY